jgi:hypothetical protein
MLRPDGIELLKFFWGQPSIQRLSTCGLSGAYWGNSSTENQSSLGTLLSIKYRKSLSLSVDLPRKISSPLNHLLQPTSLPAQTFPRKRRSARCSQRPLKMPLTYLNTYWSSTLFRGIRQLRHWLIAMSKISMTKPNRLSARTQSVTVDSMQKYQWTTTRSFRLDSTGKHCIRTSSRERKSNERNGRRSIYRS